MSRHRLTNVDLRPPLSCAARADKIAMSLVLDEKDLCRELRRMADQDRIQPNLGRLQQHVTRQPIPEDQEFALIVDLGYGDLVYGDLGYGDLGYGVVALEPGASWGEPVSCTPDKVKEPRARLINTRMAGSFPQPQHAGDESRVKEQRRITAKRASKLVRWFRNWIHQLATETDEAERTEILAQLARQELLGQDEIDAIRLALTCFAPKEHESPAERLLETFNGVVEQIEGDTAYIWLDSTSGERMYGTYSAKELLEKGIRERRRFMCRTVQVGEAVHVRIEPVGDDEISAIDDAEILRQTSELFGDGLLDGDD